MAYRFILNETSYHGAGAIQEIVTEIKARGFQKALIVTDADLVRFGVVKKVTDLLDENQFAYEIFDQVKANPSVAVVQAGVEAFKKAGADYMIAIGGGSPQDTSKGIGIIINNPEFADVVSLEGVAPTKKKSVPVIAVATTAGTAAETTINYVITDEEKRRKFVCVDPHDIPVVAVVDPDMMSSMPKGLTASTGMDALTHAIEGYTTLGAWELADTLNLKAIELIARSLRKAVENDSEGRRDMALGQYVTGMAFSNVGLGVVHGMAHPLSAFYDTPHGVANAVLLPVIAEYNALADHGKYLTIYNDISPIPAYADEFEPMMLVDAIRELCADIGIPENLTIAINNASKTGTVTKEEIESKIESMAVDAMKSGNIAVNPRASRQCDIEMLYRRAL